MESDEFGFRFTRRNLLLINTMLTNSFVMAFLCLFQKLHAWGGMVSIPDLSPFPDFNFERILFRSFLVHVCFVRGPKTSASRC